METGRLGSYVGVGTLEGTNSERAAGKIRASAPEARDALAQCASYSLPPETS